MDDFDPSSSSTFYTPGLEASLLNTSYVSPWLQMFHDNMDALNQLAGKVPSNLEPARLALLRAGNTIQQSLDAGAAVSSDDAKIWLASTARFAAHLNATQGASIISNATAGQSTADDSIVQPAVTATSAAVDQAHAFVEQILTDIENLPWGWVALAVGVVVVVPFMFGDRR